MKMHTNKLDCEELKKVSGGTGAVIASAEGMENYPSELKNCPGCGSSRLNYETVKISEGVGKIGQRCECGRVWTFGSRTSVI